MTPSSKKPARTQAFARRLLRWFDRHGRHDLPWQHPRTPYRVWLAEVMLQQTQVATAIPYFERFLARFPDLAALAAAPLDEVLALWSGLGYYARARNLHRAAQLVVRTHGGEFPRDFAAVAALPGIGRSTAGAVLAQAYGARHAILDGNVRRVLARWAAVPGWPGQPAVQNRLWVIAEALLPQARLADYTQALMDLGATLCTARQPRCAQCPLRADCQALARGQVEDFPAPRPARVRPVRQAQLLLARNARGELLLQRRPPAGIWGGLWCPPLLDDGADWPDALRALGLAAGAARELPLLRHGFSHFELRITPLLLNTEPRAAIADAAASAWMTPQQAAQKGLPAPIRKLLLALGQDAPLRSE